MGCREFLYTGAYRGGKKAGHAVMRKKTGKCGFICEFMSVYRLFCVINSEYPGNNGNGVSLPLKKYFGECYGGKNCRICT
jgi:hypothetical protein